MLKKEFKNLLDLKKPIILDGGLATQLESQGHDLNSSLWSAALLINDPQAITDAHLAYLNAGAQIITSSSYQASIDGFKSLGFSKDQALELISKSVELAVAAMDQFCHERDPKQRPLVAASVGPYGAYLADGSEYTGRYTISEAALVNFHQQRLQQLDSSGADILACETIPSFREVQVLTDLLNQVNTPAWMSFSCRDSKHLNDGTEIEKAVELLMTHEQVLAVGINCTPPDYISSLVDRIKSVTKETAIIVYPNSGEVYDAQTKSWSTTESAEQIHKRVINWKQQGVQVFGGCCRIGPSEIAQLKRSLNE